MAALMNTYASPSPSPTPPLYSEASGLTPDSARGGSGKGQKAETFFNWDPPTDDSADEDFVAPAASSARGGGRRGASAATRVILSLDSSSVSSDSASSGPTEQCVSADPGDKRSAPSSPPCGRSHTKKQSRVESPRRQPRCATKTTVYGSLAAKSPAPAAPPADRTRFDAFKKLAKETMGGFTNAQQVEFVTAMVGDFLAPCCKNGHCEPPGICCDSGKPCLGRYELRSVECDHQTLQNPADFLVIKQAGACGKGCFAKSNIPPGQVLVQYKGFYHTTKEVEGWAPTDPRREYLFSLKHSKHFVLNPCLDESGKLADFDFASRINHACKPLHRNVFFHENALQQVFVVTLREIKAGEQLFIDYTYKIDPCKCPGCVAAPKAAARKPWRRPKQT